MSSKRHMEWGPTLVDLWDCLEILPKCWTAWWLEVFPLDAHWPGATGAWANSLGTSGGDLTGTNQADRIIIPAATINLSWVELNPSKEPVLSGSRALQTIIRLHKPGVQSLSPGQFNWWLYVFPFHRDRPIMRSWRQVVATTNTHLKINNHLTLRRKPS